MRYLHAARAICPDTVEDVTKCLNFYFFCK